MRISQNIYCITYCIGSIVTYQQASYLILFVQVWVKCFDKAVYCIILYGKSRSLSREQPNQNKEMKIADSVSLSLFIRDNEKCNISHAPNIGLSGIQFSMLYVLVPLTPKDQRTRQNITLRWSWGDYLRPPHISFSYLLI